MIKSMTGFGRSVNTENGRNILVEIKTVNHRYSDIYIKLPKSLTYLEDKIKSKVSGCISRGKTDIFISYEDTGESGRNVITDVNLAKAYTDALITLKDMLGLKDDLTVSMISSLPDVLQVEKNEEDEDAIWGYLERSVTEALEGLTAMRSSEGIKLKESLLERIKYFETLMYSVSLRAPDVVKEYKTKLEVRISELLDQKIIDENRLATEVALFADRCSIDEELVRLGSHLSQLRGALDSNEAVGRKLDFLIQEMNREVNTIGSKANDLAITQNVVEMKSELEKIREQIQNIE